MMWSSIKNEKTDEGFQIIQKSFSHVILIKHDHDKCVLCAMCERICPKNAISLKKQVSNEIDNLLQIDEKKCVQCGLCAYICMFNALNIKHLTFEVINKNEVLMEKIGGLPELKSRITINYDSCNSCKACQKICPRNAIDYLEDQIKINENKCIKCGWCASICPEKAIDVVKLFEGNLELADNITDEKEIKELISACPTKCIRYKDFDKNNLRNVKTKKILGKIPDSITWLREFCILCGACNEVKPNLIKIINRNNINADEPFLKNKMWDRIKQTLLNDEP